MCPEQEREERADQGRIVIHLVLYPTRTSGVGAAVTEHELRDISIIGGGPTGLFAAFYAGMRAASARIIDALPALGGQLLALYPEKYIFDVAGFPKVLAKDLVRDMTTQALQFGATTHLGEVVVGLRRVGGDVTEGGHFVLETATDSFPTRTIVIAAGSARSRPAGWASRVRTDSRRRASTSRCSIRSSSRASASCSWAAEIRPSTGP
jgi:NADPH-dependent 2,4-dienoyl-CoA reductase/sulfur reductase-like enzyme